MEKNRDTQTWFWEFPGNVKLTVPSADFKRGGKELLQAVRKIFGDGLKDMYLQDVHYNLPIGANRIKLENNMTALLTEYVDRHPLKSYRTLAEDDKFVVIGDTLSPDIRAYRKLSENEVSKVLHEYATKEDLSLVPMDKELQVLASKIEQKGKEPKYYSQVAYLQMSDDTREFDKLQDRKDYKGLLNLAAMYDQGEAINQQETFKRPEQYRGDDLLDENKNYAVVYNNTVGGTYSVMRKVTEDDIRLTLDSYGLDKNASPDVKEIFNRYDAEKKCHTITSNSSNDEVKEDNPDIKNYSSSKRESKGYQIWAEKEFPKGYFVKPLQRKDFPMVGFIPLQSYLYRDGGTLHNNRPPLAFNVGNEKLALYILKNNYNYPIDRERYQELVANFNQLKDLVESRKQKAHEVCDIDKAIVDSILDKGYFLINIKTPGQPIESYTLVMSPQGVNHGSISEAQLEYAESRKAVVIKTTQTEFDSIISAEIGKVNSADIKVLEEWTKHALSRIYRNLGILKDMDKFNHLGLYEDRWKRDIVASIGTIEAAQERLFSQNAKKVEGMYYHDALHDEYVVIGKLKDDETYYPHFRFSTPAGAVNAFSIINDFREGLLKTEEEIQKMRSSKEGQDDNIISSTMPKIKEPQVKQEKASLTKSQAELKEKTANEKHEETKQHRPPQMITVNGEKVTHAHAFQSNKKPDDWFFTAKLDGQQLRPQHMKPEDVKAYQDHTSTVENLMQTYYPSKVAKKVSPEEYKADNKLSDGRVVDKIFVYKEHDENRPDVGKYKLYAQVGDLKMSRTLSTEDLNAFFDRVTTPAKLVEKNFGEHLHLASAYQKYQLPENSGVEKVSIHKNQEGTYVISASMGDKGVTPERKVEWNDLYSYFKAKTATRSQLAAKYLMDDIRSAQTIKNDVTRGLKV